MRVDTIGSFLHMESVQTFNIVAIKYNPKFLPTGITDIYILDKLFLAIIQSFSRYYNGTFHWNMAESCTVYSV